MICYECDAKMKETRGDYQYLESGLDNVTLKGVTIFVCPKGHRLPALSNIKELHDLIAQRLLTKPALLSGQEIKFLRKQMRLKATEFARLLGLTRQYVSRLENEAEPVGPQTDKLIRLAFIRKQEEESGEIYRDVVLVSGVLPQISKRIVRRRNVIYHATLAQMERLKKSPRASRTLPWFAKEKGRGIEELAA